LYKFTLIFNNQNPTADLTTKHNYLNKKDKHLLLEKKICTDKLILYKF